MKEDLELQKRIAALSTTDLVRMLTIESNDYREEALHYAARELQDRSSASGRNDINAFLRSTPDPRSQRNRLDVRSNARQERRTPKKTRSHPAVCVLLLALIGATGYGISVTPALLKKEFPEIEAEQANKAEALQTRNREEIATRRGELEVDLAAVNAAALRRSAAEQYKQELAGRKSYDKRFALSSREKAQLHMKALASDSTKSFHDAIRAVAREASPKGADIGVRESVYGIALHIDFNMSSMTSGEHGTRTKHHTKESLRNEVISLISRVTNDAFQFCKDLNLSSIHVGCRHIVQTKYPYGQTREENAMLYKIHVRKRDIGEFTSNPFLDVYSTTRHFEVDEDNFDDIEIITTRI